MNGSPYLDTLSHEAVRRFITVTHEAYAKHCGSNFGTIIPGIFTDEPNHSGMFYDEGGSDGAPKGSSHISWTRELPAIFRQRYGYDLMPHLVEIFFDVDGREVTPTRYHYHDCVALSACRCLCPANRRVVRRPRLAAYRPPDGKCSLTIQAQSLGSAMRYCEHVQVPGMDLGDHCRNYTGAKQVSSVARQLGRKWRLTESYAGTGWDFPLCGYKALGDWQAALGINLRCPHLAWYTMEGQSKRDFPGSISYQSPWWPLYARVEDHFARVHTVMTRGDGSTGHPRDPSAGKRLAVPEIQVVRRYGAGQSRISPLYGHERCASAGAPRFRFWRRRHPRSIRLRPAHERWATAAGEESRLPGGGRAADDYHAGIHAESAEELRRSGRQRRVCRHARRICRRRRIARAKSIGKAMPSVIGGGAVSGGRRCAGLWSARLDYRCRRHGDRHSAVSAPRRRLLLLSLCVQHGP